MPFFSDFLSAAAQSWLQLAWASPGAGQEYASARGIEPRARLLPPPFNLLSQVVAVRVDVSVRFGVRVGV